MIKKLQQDKPKELKQLKSPQVLVVQPSQQLELKQEEDEVEQGLVLSMEAQEPKSSYEWPDEELLKRRAQERMARLRNKSFNPLNIDHNSEFDETPAYLRRNLELHNTLANVEDFYSRATVRTDDNNQKYERSFVGNVPLKITESEILKTVPRNINDSKILHLLYNTNINWKYFDEIKMYSGFNDEILSDWLNISVKTFREYKKPNSVLKENVKEQVLLLFSLIKHGSEIFGSAKEFNNWLNQDNFYFDNKSPVSFMNTITGLKFIDDRLTAMEYGDNV